MFVPLTWEVEKSSFYKFVCAGNQMSTVIKRLFVLNGKSWNMDQEELCGEKHTHIAYNNYARQFEVSETTGKMVKYNFTHETGGGMLPWEWEIQEKFFESNNIKPLWFNCNFTWGSLNQSTGKWTGGIGMIQRDEVDYALFDYAGTYARSKVASISPGNQYSVRFWLTRHPKQLSPTWNLLLLLTKVLCKKQAL